MKAVMDTSSLISLELSGILQRSLKLLQIVIPSTVKEELEEISKYSDEEGKAAKLILKLIQNKKIPQLEIKDYKKVENLLSSDVDRGEAECFVLCLENKITILIMDDVDAAYSLEGLAKVNDIKLKISVAVIIELSKKKIITKKQALRAIRKMINIREWEGGALEVLAKKYLKE